MVAARERGGVPGSAAPYGTDARSTASSLGNLALPFSFVLAAFSNPAHVGAVIGQTALCSPVFYFLFARALSACGLRNCPPSSCRAASARCTVFPDSFFSGNSRLLQAGLGHSTRRLASRDTILVEPFAAWRCLAVSRPHGTDAVRVLSFTAAADAGFGCALSTPR